MVDEVPPWNICDDCLDPLASELEQFANQAFISFDCEEYAKLYHELSDLENGFKGTLVVDHERKVCRFVEDASPDKRSLRGELRRKLEEFTLPTSSEDLDRLYKSFDLDTICQAITAEVSADSANLFRERLRHVRKLLFSLEMAASRYLMDAAWDSPGLVLIPHAIQQATNAIRYRVRFEFPNAKAEPHPTDMSEALEQAYVRVIQRSQLVQGEFEETVRFIRQTSGLLRLKQGRTKKAAPGESLVNRSAPENKAEPTGFLGGTELADALGVHPSQRDAFARQLTRRRHWLGDSNYTEACDRRPNSPRFLYRVDSPEMRRLAADYQRPKLT